MRSSPSEPQARRSAIDAWLGRWLPSPIVQIRFAGQIWYWNPERSSGLAVVNIPAPQIQALGGLKQQRVRGSIGGAEFVSSVMPAGGGRLALSVSKTMMTAAGVGLGDEAEFEIALNSLLIIHALTPCT